MKQSDNSDEEINEEIFRNLFLDDFVNQNVSLHEMHAWIRLDEWGLETGPNPLFLAACFEYADEHRQRIILEYLTQIKRSLEGIQSILNKVYRTIQKEQ